MLRIVCLALLALLSTPTVLAAPHADVAVGPGGIVDPRDDPYYLWASATQPEAPHEGTAADDCGADSGAQEPGAVEALAQGLAAWHPLDDFSASSWFPGCVSAGTPSVCAPVGTCLALGAYAAYDVGTGAYYVSGTLPLDEVGLVIDTLPGPDGQRADETFAFGGNSGVALLADCEACPPPP